MKTILKSLLVTSVVVCTPLALMAQWNLVRWDQSNFYARIHAASPDVAFASGLMPSGAASFLLRTNDGGTTWDSLPFTSASSGLVSTLFFTDVDHGFAGGVENNLQMLLRTPDNGNSWISITPNPNAPAAINALSFQNFQTGYAADESTLYYTNDGGTTWASTVPGFGIKDIAFSDVQNGYACGTLNNEAVVMKTTDGGVSWNGSLAVNFNFFQASSMLKLDAVNPDVVVVSGLYTNLLYKTVDGGITWDTLALNQIYSIQDFDFISANEGHVVSTMGEIFETHDGGLNWSLEYAVASGAYGPSVFLNSLSFRGTTGYVCGSDGLIKKHTAVTVGITDAGAVATFEMFPNPLTAGHELQFSNLDPAAEIRITNLQGQVVGRQAGISMLQLNDLAAGTYMVTVTDAARQQQKLLVVY